jgi:hypothetical protein
LCKSRACDAASTREEKRKEVTPHRKKGLHPSQRGEKERKSVRAHGKMAPNTREKHLTPFKQQEHQKEIKKNPSL